MKLSEFIKLQNRKLTHEKELINTSGYGDISINELWSRIYYKTEEWVARGCDDAEIKEMIEREVGDYELRTTKIKEKTKSSMLNLGFNFEDDEE